MKSPDFSNIAAVFERKIPARPALFEFYLNGPLYKRLADEQVLKRNPDYEFDLKINEVVANASANAGYDYVCGGAGDMFFQTTEQDRKSTISLNAGSIIADRDSFKRYNWPDPDSYDYSVLDNAKDWLPEAMKLIVSGPGGVLENVIALVGYENLCMMQMDDPRLLADIFNEVGSRLTRYYEIVSKYETVGACMSNDDWGFKTQTMLCPADMRKYVFTWHKKIVEAIHDSGKYALLHSCGQLEDVMEDIIEDMKYDAKHSFEDNILPIEQAYDKWSDRIAILGGIDLDFLCRSNPEQIAQRSKKMLERASQKGAYALGSGNSIPEYVPDEHFFAMIETVNEF
jgi:uroporphyrinogen decarboxylase